MIIFTVNRLPKPFLKTTSPIFSDNIFYQTGMPAIAIKKRLYVGV